MASIDYTNTSSNSDNSSTLPSECDIVIVGAGVAGATAAYHLAKTISGGDNVPNILVVESGPKPGEGIHPRRSGSATMNGVASTVKMMVQLFASKSSEFIHHHGKKGARRYLRLTAEGLKLQKNLAKNVLDNPKDQLKELGSYYLAYEDDKDELWEEYETLKSIGSDCCRDINWVEKDQLQQVQGMSPDFHCAIHFPNDAVIDSSSYAKGLLRAAEATGTCQVVNNTKVSEVVDDTTNPSVLVEQRQQDVSGGEDGGAQLRRIRCKHIVMATGGLFRIPALNGLLKPCYSYLVHVPIPTVQNCQDSPNFFTWGYTHDWSFTNGSIRCSGEDHFSAYKPPHCEERCTNLSKWTLQKYGADDNVDSSTIPQQYGVYSETPDLAPLIGHTNSTSKVCYLLGCNAWGQTVLSYSGSLIPGLLGYKELTEKQKDSLQLLSIRRFSYAEF